jgi:hypothetical protein
MLPTMLSLEGLAKQELRAAATRRVQGAAQRKTAPGYEWDRWGQEDAASGWVHRILIVSGVLTRGCPPPPARRSHFGKIKECHALQALVSAQLPTKAKGKCFALPKSSRPGSQF